MTVFARCDLPEIVSMTPVLNTESESVMRKIGMRKEQGTFTYPGMTSDHPLAEHLLYRLTRNQWQAIS